MLEKASGKYSRLAWLHDSKESRALRISRRSASAKTGSLSFFDPDFGLDSSEPWLVGEPTKIATEPGLETCRPLPKIEHRLEPSPAHFAEIFEDIQVRIARGEFEKVVPMITERIEFGGQLSLDMFPPALTLSFPDRYSYGYEFGGEGLCGVTPELLFRVEDGILKTMALAGTGRAGGPSLLDDKKERHEHGVVIEFLNEALKKFGSVSAGETHEKTFGVLKHLRTEIEVKLKDEPEFGALVKALHPTAALGGWPRHSSAKWMEAQAFHKTRAHFGAPFGYRDAQGKMVCVVAIRGIQWSGRSASISVGCGVVKESQTLREWAELQLKFKAVHQLLGMEE